MTLHEAKKALGAACRELGDDATQAEWQRVRDRFIAINDRLLKDGVGSLDLEPLMVLEPPPPGTVLPPL